MMAQTELMLRLIFCNKIVGYMQIYNGEIYYQYNNTNAYINPLKHQVPLSSTPPLYDSIELGIKVGDDWIFPGDIIEVTDKLHPHKSSILAIFKAITVCDGSRLRGE